MYIVQLVSSLISDLVRLSRLFLQELFHLLRLMLHAKLSILGLRDQGVQLIQVGSHFLVQIDLLRLEAAVCGLTRDIPDSVVRRLHRHDFIRLRLLLVLLLLRVGIRLLELVTRCTAARMHLSLQ